MTISSVSSGTAATALQSAQQIQAQDKKATNDAFAKIMASASASKPSMPTMADQSVTGNLDSNKA